MAFALRSVAVAGLSVASLLIPTTWSGHTLAAPTRAAANPCHVTFPDSPTLRTLAVASGQGTTTTFGGSPYVFLYTVFAGNSLNSQVHHFLKVNVPADDKVVTFSFEAAKSKQIFSGLANSYQSGGNTHLCLNGTAYLNLGNGSGAAQALAVTVKLTGKVQSTTARVDMWVGKTHYFVFGPPHPYAPAG